MLREKAELEQWVEIVHENKKGEDEDYDEDALPSFGGEALSPINKGKQRASEPLASASSGSNIPSVSGNIGTPANGAPSNGSSSSSRRTVGGVRVETRSVNKPHFWDERSMIPMHIYTQVYWR